LPQDTGIKFFQSPNFIATKFSITKPYGNQNFQSPTLRRSTNFNHHLTMAVYQMVIKFFWSPFDTPAPSINDYNFRSPLDGVGVLDGDRKNSITI
jgi:hypothetical protein